MGLIKNFDAIAIMAGERNISFDEMLKRITLFSQKTKKSTPEDAEKTTQEREKTMIVCENREGFLYAFYSVWFNRNIAIPVDALSDKKELAYIMNDSKPTAVWTTEAQKERVEAAIKETGLDIKMLLVDEFERAELDATIEPADIEYNDNHTATIIYTSGTTGSPKGVMLSFRNMLANIYSVSVEVPVFTPDRRTIILLPLHHVLPLQGTVVAPILSGAGVAIAPSMTAKDIMETLQRGKIGVFVGVPRLWQTLYNGIMKKVNASALTRALFKLCEKVNSTKFSRFVFKKIYDSMGGHLEACPSGGAALDPAVWRGLHTLGIDLMEGYGMTECAPIISFSRPDDLRPGCVGKPLPSCTVVIKDGEVCVKGPNVMQGYYNRPQETADIIDSEGYLHTGDLGHLDEEGHLYITGRKKEIIVLSNGKNINPSELEAKIETDIKRVKEAAIVEEDDMLKVIIHPQPTWSAGKTLQEIEDSLRHDVIDLYNKTVAAYKRVCGIYVYYDDLPRTRMDKIQRFKLNAIISALKSNQEPKEATEITEPDTVEYKELKAYIEGEKKIQVLPFNHIITDLGFDSLDIVGMQCFLEQKFGIEISQSDLIAFTSIQDLSEFISKNKQDVEDTETDWKKLLTNLVYDAKLPKIRPTAWWLLSINRGLIRSYFKMKTEGVENIPSEGNFIIVCNHQSFLDTMFITQALSKKVFLNTRYFAKEDHIKGGLLRGLAKSHGVIILHGDHVKESIMQLGNALRAGSNLLIFPEGTRTEDDTLGIYHSTFAILSHALNVPVLPIVLNGAYEALPKHTKLPKRKPVTVKILPAINPDKYEIEADLLQAVYNATNGDLVK